MIEVVAEEIEGFDGAIEGGTKLLNEVFHFGFVEQVGLITGAGAGQNCEVREMLFGMFDDFHAGVFIIDGDHENLCVGRSCDMK